MYRMNVSDGRGIVSLAAWRGSVKGESYKKFIIGKNYYLIEI